MPYIVVDDEQARIIAEAQGEVAVRDRQGRHLGYVAHGFTAEEIDEAKRRRHSTAPRYTTQQVLEHLGSLDAS